MFFALPWAIRQASIRVLAPIALILESNDFATVFACAALAATPIDRALVTAAASGATAARQWQGGGACRVEGFAGLMAREIASTRHIGHLQGCHRPIASGSGNWSMSLYRTRRLHAALIGVAPPQYHEYRPEDGRDHDYQRHVPSRLADLWRECVAEKRAASQQWPCQDAGTRSCIIPASSLRHCPRPAWRRTRQQ